MARGLRVTVGVVALSVLASGCFGPFNLTRRLYRWNEQVEGKWEREFMFILLAWAPVYGLAVLGDAIVFNSMEFWTGTNPVDPPPPARKSQTPSRKRLVRGNDEALLTYLTTSTGAHLLVEQVRSGTPFGSLRIEQRGGRSVGSDGEGRILFTAQTLPSGSVLIVRPAWAMTRRCKSSGEAGRSNPTRTARR